MDQLSLMSPYMQFGFAGFAFILLGTLTGVLVWLVKSLLKEIRAARSSGEKNNKAMLDVVANNTAALQQLSVDGRETKEIVIEIRNLLLSRPCMGAKVS